MSKSMMPVLIESNQKDLVAFSMEDYPSITEFSRYVVKISNELNEQNKLFTGKHIIAMNQIPVGSIGLTQYAFDCLNLKQKNSQKLTYQLEIRELPESYSYIKRWMKFKDFNYDKDQIESIVSDIVTGKMSKLEKAAFVLSQHYKQFSMDEIEHFTSAIANSGERINFAETTYDKHSLGGVPGNKVTLLIVPIVAAADLLIPKTSSRAITSPSGTADTMEALGCNVSFSASEIVELSSSTRGLIVWGGALNLAPADDILIKEVEFPLGIDPQSMFMASIMAKKKAMGVDFVVLDIPTGKGAKVTSMQEAQYLSRSFAELGQRLGIQVECAITFASAPVGHYIGPALEAREALSALINPKKASTSLIEKSTILAGMVLEQAGKTIKGQGQTMAKDILYSGKAYSKMQEIMEAQDGNPNLKPEDIPVGKYTTEFCAPASGWPADISNSDMNRIAKTAGAPTEKGAGIEFVVKKEAVKAGDVVFRVYANSASRIAKVESLIPKLTPVTIEGMLLDRI